MRWRSDSLKPNLCQAQQRDLKTIAPLSHRPIVLTDTIDYRTIGFLHYRPNPSVCVCTERIERTIEIEKKYMEIEERGVKLRLTVVDTPGFNDAVDARHWYTSS